MVQGGRGEAVTLKEFIGQCVAYYGEYRPGALAHIQHYLAQYREIELDALWRRVLLDYSGRWHYPPDIAVLEEAARVLDRDSPGYSRLAWVPPKQKALPEPLEDTDREAAQAILADWKVHHE